MSWIHDWLHDSKVSQQEKAFFRTIINRKQLIKEIDFPGSALLVETANGERINAVGCLAAYESESYVISMNTSDFWQTEEIVGTYVTLEQDDEQVAIENCCFEEQLYFLREKEKSRIILTRAYGDRLECVAWRFCNNITRKMIFL